VVFKCFTEIEAERFRLCNEFFINVKNEIVFVSQVYLHPRACWAILCYMFGLPRVEWKCVQQSLKHQHRLMKMIKKATLKTNFHSVTDA